MTAPSEDVLDVESWATVLKTERMGIAAKMAASNLVAFALKKTLEVEELKARLEGRPNAPVLHLVMKGDAYGPEADTVRHLRQRVEHARHVEAKAFDMWFASRGGEPEVREGYWADWIVARSALDRCVSMLRAEAADRARLKEPKP